MCTSFGTMGLNGSFLWDSVLKKCISVFIEVICFLYEEQELKLFKRCIDQLFMMKRLLSASMIFEFVWAIISYVLAPSIRRQLVLLWLRQMRQQLMLEKVK